MFNTQMPNMYSMGMMKPPPFDPNKIDPRYKRTWISENLSQCKVGFYKNFTKYEHMPFGYVNCDVQEPDNICDVRVVHEHSLDVAEIFANKGSTNFTKQNNLNPVILNIVGKDFMASSFESSEDMRDEIINIRTGFCVCPTRSNIFPIKENQCVYTPLVPVIRPKDPRVGTRFLPYNVMYRTAIITACPIKHEEERSKLSSQNLIKTLATIECIFQCAIANNHQVLILPPFGHEEDNNPIDDIIKIYNFCIMKYSHKFKHIIFAVPPHYPDAIYEIYTEGIISPSNLVKSIDDKYQNISIKKTMENRLTKALTRKTL
jgi:hypothetical protein